MLELDPQRQPCREWLIPQDQRLCTEEPAPSLIKRILLAAPRGSGWYVIPRGPRARCAPLQTGPSTGDPNGLAVCCPPI